MDSLTPCLAEKFGYTDVADFEKNAQKKFSLVETGVVDQPNCRLLMLNVCVLSSPFVNSVLTGLGCERWRCTH